MNSAISSVRGRLRFAVAAIIVLPALIAATAGPALAGKDHCRNLELTGAAGPASQDDVELQATDYLGNVLDRSCEITVQADECADALAERLVAEWGNGAAGGSQLGCGTDLGDQTCGKNLDLVSATPGVENVFCKHKYKKGKVKGGNKAIEELLGACPEPPPNGEKAGRGQFKKFPRIEICCFEATNADVLANPAIFNYQDTTHCKGKPLGKTLTSPQRVEISVFDRIDRPTVIGDGLFFEPKLPDNSLDVPVGLSSRQISLDPIGFFQRPATNLKDCRASVASSTNRLSRGIVDQLVRCHETVMGGSGTANCNIIDALSDPQDRAGSLGQALRDDIRDDCDGPDVLSEGAIMSPSVYGLRSCPAPCAGIDVSTCSFGMTGSPCVSDRDCDTSPGATDGKCGDWDDAVDCIRCVQEAAITAAVAEVYGDPPPGAVPDDGERGCRETLGDSLRAIVKTAETETLGCQKKADSAKTALPADAPLCKDADLKGKRAQLAQKVDGAIGKRCPSGGVAALDVCSGATTLNDLATCVVAAGNAVNAAMSNVAFPESNTECGNDVLETGEQCDGAEDGACPGLCQPDCTCVLSCPSSVDMRIRAGTGLSGTTASFIDHGFSGLFHEGDVVDEITASFDLTCSPPEPPCGDCTIDGVSSTGPQSQAFTRCLDDLSIQCNTPFSSDPTCPVSGACVSVLGPPRPHSGGGFPLCTVTALAADAGGTVNPGGGGAELVLQTRGFTYLGTRQLQPCPVCSGDTTPQDGVPDGTCNDGPRDGLACDGQGFDATFASSSSGLSLSLDCPPSPGSGITSSGQDIAMTLTTGTSTLPFATSCGGPLAGIACACAMCSGAPTKPCASNADCTGVEGTCTSSGSGVSQRQPNSCSDLTCTDIGGGRGVCGADTQSYCDGALRADGSPIIPCLTQTDCDALDPECPAGDCGNCALSLQPSCYNDPIVAVGSAAVLNRVLAGTACAPPTESSVINSSFGLPGAVRVTLDVLTHFNP